jgi:hypothetical protein
MKKTSLLLIPCAVAAGLLVGGFSASAQTPALQLKAVNYNASTGVWTDSSGNNDTATWGAVVSGSPAKPTLATGVTPNGSSAVNITSTGGSFALASSLAGTSGYTIFEYILPSVDTGGGRYAITGGSAGYALEYDFYQGHQNYLSEYQGGGGAGTSTISTSSFSLLDIAVGASGGTFTGATFRANGAADGTAGAGAGSSTTPITRIGNNEGGGDSLLGEIAEIDIYTGVLTSGQIATEEAALTAAYITPAPEPTTWALVAAGFVLLLAVRRIRSQQA